MRKPGIRATGLSMLFFGLIVAALVIQSATGGGDSVEGGGTTFEDIVADDPAEYDFYQVKFTYTGKQTKATPTLLLAGIGRSPNVDEFEPYRSPGVHYGNDAIAVLALVLGADDTIERFINGLAARPPLQVPAFEQLAGGFSDPILSLMIERGLPPDEIVFEHLADDIDADQIITLLEGATRDESADTREIIRRFRNFTVGPH